jgi:acyl-CoA thioester hydrolase
MSATAGSGSAASGRPVFRHSVRVPYAHTDQMGVVYYANFFVYFEMARSAVLREAGTPYGELERRGVLLPVVEAQCRYRRPARFDDLLEIRLRFAAIHHVRLRFEYEIWRQDPPDGGADGWLATGHTVHVCTTRAGKVARLPPDLLRLAGGPGTGSDGQDATESERPAP